MSLSGADTARIRRIAALSHHAAEAYISLGQSLIGATPDTGPPPTSVVRELDRISEHLLALAADLARLAAAIEEAGPPRPGGVPTRSRAGPPRRRTGGGTGGGLADPHAGS